jgi:hypothetical protein
VTVDFADYEQIKARHTGANGQTAREPKQVRSTEDAATWKEPDGEYIRRKLPLTDWLTRDVAEPEFMLGELLSTTSRILLVGPTGRGKTNFALAIAVAVAAGTCFLHWRAGQRLQPVLYIDGEMPERLMRTRLEDTIRRCDLIPERLFILSRADFPDMPPLNTVAGQQFIDRVIEIIGGVGFVVFDNIQSLLIGDMKDEEPWQQTLPWIRDLTRCKIGQIWVHHTGHNETHSYGTKTREWQLDTVILLESVERAEADIAFALSFTKARERTPDNRADFEPAIIKLQNDEWTSERGSGRKVAKSPPPLARKFYDALIDAIAANGVARPQAGSRPCVTKQEWEDECLRLGLIDTKAADSRRALMSKNRRELIAGNWLACNGNFVWSIR